LPEAGSQASRVAWPARLRDILLALQAEAY